MASKFGFLGSLDINTGDTSVGWDTDQFLMDPKTATTVMLTIIIKTVYSQVVLILIVK